MTTSVNFLAIDLGAAEGRVLLGNWNGKQFDLKELHRFANEGVSAPGGFYWDIFRIWAEVKTGIAKYALYHTEPLAGISVDAWGVDFGLLDSAGELLGNPHHYRDSRTDGMMDEVKLRIPMQELYRRTGVRPSQINTLFQLHSMVTADSRQLRAAKTFLMIPDLFHYFLCGEMSTEYTQASTTQLFCSWEKSWEKDLLRTLSIPAEIFPPVVNPGKILGTVRQEVVKETRLSKSCPVIAGATHEIASAVAAIPGLDKNTAFLWSGTWSILGVEMPDPVITDQALNWGFTNEGGADGAFLFLKNLPGLWLLQECQRNWKKSQFNVGWEELIKQAEYSEPFPFFADSESRDFLNPLNMPEAIRSYCGKTKQPVPQENIAIIRGCLENIIFKYRSALDRLERLTSRKLTRLRIVGEGVQSRLFCQLTANATGREVIAGPADASALGNLMFQAIATGHLPNLAASRSCIARSEIPLVYVPEDTMVWSEAYHRYYDFLEKNRKATSRGKRTENLY